MITRLRYPKGYQFFDANGAPLALGSIYYYAAGSTTPQDTYSDSAGSITNTNPIILDGSGRLDTDVYLGSAADYKEVLQTVSATVSPWPDDNILRAIQIDWNATSGPGQILNKPALAAVAISGSYTDLSNTPPTNVPFGGDSGSGGTSGLVPAPAAGDALANMFLSASGQWAVPPGSGTSIDLATTAASASGTTLNFASVPSSIVPGMVVTDQTSSGAIPSGTYVVSTTGITVVLSAGVTSVGSGDTINFYGAESAVTNLSVAEAASTVSIGSSSGSGITIPAATDSVAGVLDAARAAKIDGLATVATTGSFADLTNKPLVFTGASSSVNGAVGLVPEPTAGQQGYALLGDGAWGALGAALSGQNLDNVNRIGIGTTDTGNNFSFKGPAALFANTGDMRVTMSKGATSNTAAFNFQDNYSTRTQFGLLGNDSFAISMSPDGSTFNSAIVATPAGAVSFPNTSGFAGSSSGAAGGVGLVPAPSAGQQADFLRGDGTWAAVNISPGGSSGQLQYNNVGAFGGAAGLSYGASGTNLGITAQHTSDVPLAAIGAASQTANLQEWRSSAAAVLASIGAGGVLTAKNFAAIEDGESASAWSLSARNSLYGTLPVPVFAPTGSNLPFALDICPNGSPSNFSGNGVAWIDVCNVNVQNGSPAVNTARIGNFGNAVEFGSRAFNGGTAQVVNFTFNGTTVASLQSAALMAIPSGNKLLIGATSAYTHAGALEINGGTTYTNELGAFNIHTGTDGQPELIGGVDHANNMAYLQSASRNTNLTGFPLNINPNGGAIGFGSTGAGVNSSGAFIGSGANLTQTGLWASISYNAAIPLSQLAYMPQQTVSGAITFSVAGSPAAVAGGSCYVRLVADGSHAPAFTGLKQDNKSQSYVNTNGVTNVIKFWYDGTDAWYSISQQVAVQPNFVSAQVTNANPNKIAISLASALNSSDVPAASAFSATATNGNPTISSVAISGAIVTLTLSRSIAYGETVTVSYAAPGSNPLTDSTNTYQTANFSNQSVTNNVNETPVTVSSAQVANSAPTVIAVTFTGNLNASSVPAASAFSVSASGGSAGVSSVAISGAILSLTLNRSIASGETITFSYAVPGSNPLENSDGNASVAAITNQSVTNNVSGGLGSVLRLTSLTGVTETADSTLGYDYAPTSSGTAGFGQNVYAASGTALPASTDGYFGFIVGGLSTAGTTGAPACAGFKTSSGNGPYSSQLISLYGNSSGYQQLGGATAGTSAVPTVGDILRLRRAGTTVYAELSRNSGSSWSTLFTWTGITTAQLYADFDMYTGISIREVFSSGNWA
jgi:uncharacterized repeat protein (TIGR02059 family)